MNTRGADWRKVAVVFPVGAPPPSSIAPGRQRDDRGARGVPVESKGVQDRIIRRSSTSVPCFRLLQSTTYFGVTCHWLIGSYNCNAMLEPFDHLPT